MAKTELWAIGLVLICTLLTSGGQIFLKLGAKTVSLNAGLLTNYNLLIGLTLYGLGAVFLIVALKGGELSVLYPIIATSFVWVTFLSSFYLAESLTLFKWGGVIMIIAGVSLIGKGGMK